MEVPFVSRVPFNAAPLAAVPFHIRVMVTSARSRSDSQPYVLTWLAWAADERNAFDNDTRLAECFLVRLREPCFTDAGVWGGDKTAFPQPVWLRSFRLIWFVRYVR